MKKLTLLLIFLATVLTATAEQKAVIRTHAFGME